MSTQKELMQEKEHIEDIGKFADACILCFLQNKIPQNPRSNIRLKEEELLTEFTRLTVLRTQFDNRCFNFIHQECLSVFKLDKKYDEPGVPWNVNCLLVLLRDLKKRNIPKEFHPGLLLLYFKFIWSVKIPSYPLL